MSIRNDAGARSAANIPPAAVQHAMNMHAMQEAVPSVAAGPVDEAALAECNSFNTSNPEHPLNRSLVVSIRASLNDLCLKKSKSTWAPSADALRNILQQKKFTDLQGSAEAQGDLKSVVLHKMSVSAQKNDFPLSVGLRLTGVDDSCYSITGDCYSAISLSGVDTHAPRVLQEDDVSLAYEFAKKFPGCPRSG